MAEATQNDRSKTAPDATMLLDCAFDQAALAGLRYELRVCGAAQGLADLALFNFVLAINEIATNAIRYAGGHGHLRLSRDGDTMRCAIADHGPGIPRRYTTDRARPPRPGRLAGHGLWLAQHICTSIEIETDPPPGTRVLLRFALPAVGT
jgi:serine/threonine-protein kinase RsbW